MRIYIAGPMTGLPDFNYPAFHAAAAAIAAQGDEALNPAENFGGDQSRPYADYIRRDLQMLLDADAVYFLPGWERSRGARMEWHVAEALGLPRIAMETLEPAALIHSIDGLLDADRWRAFVAEACVAKGEDGETLLFAQLYDDSVEQIPGLTPNEQLAIDGEAHVEEPGVFGTSIAGVDRVSRIVDAWMATGAPT